MVYRRVGLLLLGPRVQLGSCQAALPGAAHHPRSALLTLLLCCALPRCAMLCMLCFQQGLDERESITVIVDDSHSVWSQHRHNLVAVERYIYFPSSRASLGLKGPSLLDANRCGGAGTGHEAGDLGWKPVVVAAMA